jgi:hypothetical protein
MDIYFIAEVAHSFHADLQCAQLVNITLAGFVRLVILVWQLHRYSTVMESLKYLGYIVPRVESAGDVCLANTLTIG